MANTDRSNKIKCAPGEIERVGYHRKGYFRKTSTKNGRKISGAYVPEVDVSPKCVKDMGRKGKGPKTLPRPNDDMHLSKYGYKIDKPQNERRAALVDASNDNTSLKVLRRLNLLRNYQAIPENKDVFSSDVEFMMDLYSKRKINEREKNGFKPIQSKNSTIINSKSTKSAKSTRQIQKGGQDDENTSEETDSTETTDDVEFINVEGNLDQEIECTNGICSVNNKIYEIHQVDNVQVIYYTLGADDAQDILELDKIYLDSDVNIDSNVNIDSIIAKLEKYSDNFIGIKINGTLEGYCQFEPHGDLTVTIIWFCANKGYGRPLYTFVEKIFEKLHFEKISLIISLEGEHATRRINFWYLNGFVTYNSYPDERKIYMEKYL